MNQQLNDPNVNLSESEFKKRVIALIKSPEHTPEILFKLLRPLCKEKPEFLEAYKADDKADAISQNKNEWILSGYFDRHCRFLEQNFSKLRIEHLITVKSYLIEYGIAGFSKPDTPTYSDHQSAKSEENQMNNPFSNVDLSNFVPTRSLQSSISGGDIIEIRMALFMEMNNHRLSTHSIRQMFAYAVKHKSNLFVAFEINGYARELKTGDQSQWNAKYYALQEVYASSNFSYQRIEHMLEVRQHVFNIPKHEQKPQRSNPERQPQTSKQHRSVSQYSNSSPGQRTPRKANPNTQSDHDSLKAIILIGGVLAAVAAFILTLL